MPRLLAIETSPVWLLWITLLRRLGVLESRIMTFGEKLLGLHMVLGWNLIRLSVLSSTLEVGQLLLLILQGNAEFLILSRS
jgi:hypothetical protein